MADYTLGQQISGSLLSDVDADLRLGGLDNIDIDSSVSGKLDSDIDAKVDAKLAGKVTTDSDVRTHSNVVSDGKLVTDSRVASSVDLAPVAVDSCIRVELGALPATQLHTPWEQRLGLSVFGVELFAWVLSGQTTSTLRPAPTAPRLVGSLEQVRGEHGPGHGPGHGSGKPRPYRGAGPVQPAPGSGSGGLSIRLG